MAKVTRQEILDIEERAINLRNDLMELEKRMGREGREDFHRDYIGTLGVNLRVLENTIGKITNLRY